MRLTQEHLLPSGWPASVQVRQTYRSHPANVAQSPGAAAAAGLTDSSVYGAFNLALHVEDDPASVLANRATLLDLIVADQISWVNQVHGTNIHELKKPIYSSAVPDADAQLTNLKGSAMAIMSADCLPIVLTDKAGSEVAVIHAGWRGLLAGIIEKTAGSMSQPAFGFIGAAIQQANFEVGGEVREAFTQADAGYSGHFAAHGDKFLGDLQGIALSNLRALGISATHDPTCSFADPACYSYRRDGVTGRMAVLAWIE